MTLEQQGADRRAELEAWWALVARILAFILGSVLLMIEALSNGQRFYLIVAGLALCGPVVAQSAAAMFASVRKGGP